MKLAFASLIIGAIILFAALFYCIVTINPYNSAFVLIFGVPTSILCIGYYLYKVGYLK